MQGSPAAGARSDKPHLIDVHVGSRIRVRRLALGMSQSNLGQAIGVTFQQMQKYERGVNRITAGRLFMLAHVLDVPIGYFFDDGLTPRAGTDGEAVAPHEARVAHESGVLLQLFQRIPDPKLRQHIIALVRGVVDRPFYTQSNVPAHEAGAKPAAAERSRRRPFDGACALQMRRIRPAGG